MGCWQFLLLWDAAAFWQSRLKFPKKPTDLLCMPRHMGLHAPPRVFEHLYEDVLPLPIPQD